MRDISRLACKGVLPLLSLFALLGFSRCDDEGPRVDAGLRLQAVSVDHDDTSQFLDVFANGAWNISVHYEFDEEDEPYQWIYIDNEDISGTGIKRNIVVRYDENPYGQERVAYLRLNTEGHTYEARLIQRGEGSSETEISLMLYKKEVAANETSQLITVYSNSDWTIELEYGEDGQSGWANVEPASGEGIRNDIVLSYDRNTSGVLRKVTLILKSSGHEKRETLQQDAQDRDILDIALTKTEVDATETEQKINIQAEGAWTLAVNYPDGTAPWCTLGATGGTDSQILTLSYTANTLEQDRQATLVLTSTVTGTVKSATLTQKKKESVPPPTYSGWMELPAMANIPGSQKFVTHYANINGKRMRNFSMLFDTNERIAYWVAYPHHSVYLGSQKRTDAWAYDPEIPYSQQAYLKKGFGNGTHDRGHQIPSGDRTANRDVNVQTFFYSNMTPQIGQKFNQSIWANLENKIRGYLGGTDKPDTLYVVTGAILKTVSGNESVTYVNDNNKQKVAVPNYYFKVLLHRKNNNYRSIGFWYNHANYTRTQPDRSDTKSVRQIEELTGFDFFPGLPENIRDQVETTVTHSAWGL